MQTHTHTQPLETEARGRSVDYIMHLPHPLSPISSLFPGSIEDLQ